MAADHAIGTSTETKAQKAERLKRQKNPWQALDEIKAFARRGFDAIPPEWIATYLRWWGVYTQGDGAGVTGGSGGQGRALPYFMLRIRIPNGSLTSRQLHGIAGLASDYARGVADITVRQNIQLHWISAEALPEVLDELFRLELTTMGACGDVTRNVTGCPVAGIDATEICDASPLVLRVTQLLNGNSGFYNLPRKFKISISGCRAWCSYPEINDVGLTALRRERDGALGFALRVGGGLSTQPHLAVPLGAFVRPEQVESVVTAIAGLFRDREELRESRERARLKFLFLQHGWTPESFLAELQTRTGFALDPAEPEEIPDDQFRDHTGIHPQKQDGHFYVGASVLSGRVTPEQLHAVADIAERLAGGSIRTTNMQNLLIADVPRANVNLVAHELADAGLPVQASPFWRGAVACTGTEFCKLALTETKGFTRWLVEEMQQRVPEFDQLLRIHVTGCPNSCGQHWIADVGIEGKKIKSGGRLVDAYYFCVGGAVGLHASVARPVGYRCLATEVPSSLERLLRAYLEQRDGGENFRAFLARNSNQELRTILAGSPAPPVDRDPPTGRIPAGVGL